MIDTKRKEELSKSYLNAICAVRGISMEVQTHDDDSGDVILQKVIKINDGRKYNVRISIQLKSTSAQYVEYDNYFTYPLEKKNYDDLRMPSSIKSFLCVLILPKSEDEWIKHSVNELIIRKCMYWFDLKELPNSNNQTSVTLNLPKENYVSSEVLDNILFKIAEEELI